MPDISKIQLEDVVYNIKDETARNSINTINDEITQLKSAKKYFANRKIIFIGDSYGTGQNELSEQTSPWTVLVPQYLGLNANQYYTNSVNGSGFKHGTTFQTQLSTVAQNITNKNEITDIIIIGGYNDRYYSSSEIDTKMSEFFTYAKTTFPNADFKLACVGWSKDYDVRQSIAVNVIPIYTKCGKYGCQYLTNCEYILHNYSLFSNDKYHPNQNGQNELSYYLATAILNGSCDVVRSFIRPSYTMGDEITSSDISSSGYILEQQCNGEITFMAYLGYLTANAQNIGNNTKVNLLNLENGLIMGGGLSIFRSYQNLFCADSSNAFHNIMVAYNLVYNSTKNKCELNINSQARGDTVNNITGMLNDIIYLKIPALYC